MTIRNNKITAFKNLFISLIDKEASLHFYTEELKRNASNKAKLKLDLEEVKTEFQNISIAIKILNNNIISLKADKADIIKKQNVVINNVLINNKGVVNLIKYLNLEYLDFELFKHCFFIYKKRNLLEKIESNKDELDNFFEKDNSDLLDSILLALKKEKESDVYQNKKDLQGVQKTEAIQDISKKIRKEIEEVRQKIVLQKGYNERLRVLNQNYYTLEKTRVEIEQKIALDSTSVKNLTQVFQITPLRFFKTQSFVLNNCSMHIISVLKISPLQNNITDTSSKTESQKFYNVFVDFYKENPDFLFEHKNISYAISSIEDFRIVERRRSNGKVAYSKKVGNSYIDIHTYYNGNRDTVNHLIQMIEESK